MSLSTECSVHSCDKVKKICLLLEKYSHLNGIDDIMQYMNNAHYTLTDILNDFNDHLLQYHDSDHDFNAILHRLTANNMHEPYHACHIHQRHYLRRRRAKHRTQSVSADDEFQQSREPIVAILDRLHAYYYHSVDTNLRNSDTILSHKSISRKKTDNAMDVELFNNDKYIFHDTALDLNDTEVSFNAYEFGARFEYELSEHKFRIPVQKRYKNLQLELLQNSKQCIEREEYDEEYSKALEYYNTNQCRKLSKRTCTQTPLQLQPYHVLVLLMYCNDDEYQRAWTDSFRRKSIPQRRLYAREARRRVSDDDDIVANEDIVYAQIKYGDAELIARHEHFWWSSRYLVELIENFGRPLLNRHNRPIKKTFYRGLSRILYPTRTVAQFYEPLSTSDQQQVALKFSGHNGMILAFEYKYSTNPLNARYFDCKYFSDFTNEKECLFGGGIPMMCITNIINVLKDNEEYQIYLSALNIINSLLNGTCNHVKKLRSEYVHLCCNLLTRTDAQNLPEYVTRLVVQFRRSLQHVIAFSFQFESNKKIQPLKQLIYNEKVCFFDLHRLLKLFPNVEHIEFYNSNHDIAAIIRYILMETKNMDSKLKYITFYHRIAYRVDEDAERKSEWIIDSGYSDKIVLVRKRLFGFTPIFQLPRIQRGLLTEALI